jgi:hypothetical protein
MEKVSEYLKIEELPYTQNLALLGHHPQNTK